MYCTNITFDCISDICAMASWRSTGRAPLMPLMVAPLALCTHYVTGIRNHSREPITYVVKVLRLSVMHRTPLLVPQQHLAKTAITHKESMRATSRKSQQV